MNEQDYINAKNYAVKLARQEGLAEGKQEGLAEGLEHGRQEGVAEQKLASLKVMLSNNVPEKDILLYLNLTAEELDKLKVSL